MCAVRSVDVIKALPFVQFGFEIYVAYIAEKLVELLAVRAVRTLHLAVYLTLTSQLDTQRPFFAPLTPFNRLLKKVFEALFSWISLMLVANHFFQLDERMRKSAPIVVLMRRLGPFRQPVRITIPPTRLNPQVCARPT
jgi:hypothetical protein